jgi:hypothetical protein
MQDGPLVPEEGIAGANGVCDFMQKECGRVEECRGAQLPAFFLTFEKHRTQSTGLDDVIAGTFSNKR